MAGEVLILDYFGAALNIICQSASEGPPIPIGETTRAYAGNERTSSRGEKRQWNVRTTKIPKPMRRLIAQIIARRNQVYMAGEAILDNPVIDPLNLASLNWAAITTTRTPGILDPFGTLNAQTLAATGVNATVQQQLPDASVIARNTALWIKRRTGSGIIQLLNPDGASRTTVPVTSNWQQWSPAGSAASATRWHGILLATSGDAVDVYGAELSGEPILCSAVADASDMQAGTYLWEMSLSIFEV